MTYSIQNFIRNIDRKRITSVKTLICLSLSIAIITWWTNSKLSHNCESIISLCSDFHNFSFSNTSISIEMFKSCKNWKFISKQRSLSLIHLNRCCCWWYSSIQCRFHIISSKILCVSTHCYWLELKTSCAKLDMYSSWIVACWYWYLIELTWSQDIFKSRFHILIVSHGWIDSIW